MAFEGSTLRRASRRLEERRSARAAALDRRRQEVYRKVPAIAELDRQLRRTIADIIAASLRAGDSPAPAIEEVRERNLEQQARRVKLLTEAGFPADFLDERPYCPKCGDSGWRGPICAPA